MTRDEVIGHLTTETGHPVAPLPWWDTVLAALDDPRYQQIALSLVRQAGKSTFLATVAMVTLLLVAGCYVVYIGAAESQTQAVFHRKFRRPFERLLKVLKVDKRNAIITKRSIELPELGSKLEVIATDSRTVPGRSIDLLIFDEARDIPDEVYTALAPAVIATGGKILVASTAGRPVGFFHAIVTDPLPETFVYRSSVNDNPRASRRMIDFLRRQLARISRAAAERELDNQFSADADTFIPRGLIDAAVDDALGETATSPAPAFAFLDLSRKKDLTSLTVVLREPARRPEAPDHLVVGSLQTWDPKQSPSGETDFAEVRAALARLPERFPGLERLLVDEGAEAGSVLPWARGYAPLTLKVEGFVGSVQANMALWGALVARLHARTLSIPNHERLLAELRGLRQEEFAFGAKWRVVDSSKRLHRDVSLTLAGACYAAGEAGPVAADVGQARGAERPGEAPSIERGFHGRPTPTFETARRDWQHDERAALAPRRGFWR